MKGTIIVYLCRAELRSVVRYDNAEAFHEPAHLLISVEEATLRWAWDRINYYQFLPNPAAKEG